MRFKLKLSMWINSETFSSWNLEHFMDKVYPANAIGILQRRFFERIHTFPDGTVIDVLLFPFWNWDDELRAFDRCIIATNTSYPFENNKRWGKVNYWSLDKEGNIIELDHTSGYRKDMKIPIDLVRSIITDTPMDGANLVSRVVDMDDIRSNLNVWYHPEVWWNVVLMETSRRLARTLYVPNTM